MDLPVPNLLDLLELSDADATSGLRGRWRTVRRYIKRSVLEKTHFQQPRFFCQNSGGCGSTYIVELLADNGVARVFHEKAPDLNEVGVRHHDRRYALKSLVRLLRYTRHNVFFEANNRLFSLSPELAAAFPGAGFIHLFRHPAAAIRSAMSKPDVEEYLRTNVRFSGSLAGDRGLQPFERFCHYWTNMNSRIHSDLCQIHQAQTHPVMWLEFDDLVAGNVGTLAEFMGVELQQTSRPPANVGRVRSAGKYPVAEHWTEAQIAMVEDVCGGLYRELVGLK